MRVLWLGHNLAYPPKGGALQRNYNLLREVGERCEVHVLAFDQPITRPKGVTPRDCILALSKFCASVEWMNLSSWGGRYGSAVQALVSGRAYDFAWLSSREMRSKISESVKTICPDIIHFDTLGLAQYLPLIRKGGTVLNHHDLESYKIELRARKERNPLLRWYFRLESAKLAAAERKWCPRFMVNVVVSEDEGAMLSRACPDLRVRVVANGVDTKYFTPRPDPGTKILIFCGSLDMHPNQEAMEYFLKRIWPRIVLHSPHTQLYVVGRKPPEWLKQEEKTDSRIRVTGFVDDVRPYFQKAALCVCPILTGGGTRLKILDSLAMGVPVVATKFAASGLSLEHDKHLLLADTEEQFANHIRRLLDDASLRLRLANEGAKRVNQIYSWTVVGQTLLETYDLARHNLIQHIHQL